MSFVEDAAAQGVGEIAAAAVIAIVTLAGAPLFRRWWHRPRRLTKAQKRAAADREKGRK